MGADIAEFCRSCQQCARSKVTSAVHTQVQPIELPAKRFSHVHVDLVGPLPAAVSPTSSQLWTEARGGRKPCPSAGPLQRSVQPPSSLDGSAVFRSALYTHLGQRSTVCIGHLEPSLLHPWYISPADDSIPSTSKWDGGAIPSAAERCPTGAAGQPGLALTATLGPAWTLSCPKGGLRPLFSGDGFRRAPCPT